MNRPIHITGIFGAILMLCIQASHAGSAIWDVNPTSGDWNTAANWTPMTVPNNSADTATFGFSNTRNVSISANTEVNGIMFNPGASAYTITAGPTPPVFSLTLSGTGITNNSGIMQNFIVVNGGAILFRNNATAGSSTTFTETGGTTDGAFGGHTVFSDTSTAANGTFINNGGTVVNFRGNGGGFTSFFNMSTAGSATITNNSGRTNFGSGGVTNFSNMSTAGSATITNKGAAFDGAFGGSANFFDTSTAGSATITNTGATANGGPSSTEFSNGSSAGSAIIINDGIAASGGSFGGRTNFIDTSTAGTATITNNGARVIGTGGGDEFEGGKTTFSDKSSAGNGTFINNGAAVSGGASGSTLFEDFPIGSSPTAANGTFINNGGTVSGAQGGITEVSFSATAGHGTFINNGAAVSGAQGGITKVLGSAANGTFINNGGTVSGAQGGITEVTFADNGTFIANGGIGGGQGGSIFLRSSGGTARFEVFGNGFLDLRTPRFGFAGVTIGSIEGDGVVFLGGNKLNVGSNNLSTTFSGVIQGGGANPNFNGALTKIGSGTLVLAGANTYSGKTQINDGVLQVDGSINSNTFVGHPGSLAGVGTIRGDVRNSGTVRPGNSAPGTLTVSGNYIQTKSGVLAIDIAGTSTGQVSLLDVLGDATLDGMLDPVLQNDFVPLVGEQFVFLEYGSLSGSLFIHDRNIDDAMEHWVISYEPGQAILTVAAGNVSVPDQGSTLLLMTLSLVFLFGLHATLRHS